MTTSGTTCDNEWQRVTMSDKKWKQVVQRMTTSGKTSDNEWQRMRKSDNKWERMTANDNEWQQVIASGTTNENSTVHLKE